jgi:hypothetical protein
VSSAPAGWYADPQDATLLRYWDGSSWTEHRAPAQQAAAGAPAVVAAPAAPIRTFADVYGEGADLMQVLTPEQREAYGRHTLTRFPTWLVVVLHFLTIGIFTLVYQGLKLSRLPVVKHDDFGPGKAIGFMFIPFFNYYWVFRFALGITERLNFQFRLRGQPPPVSRGLALASCIVWVTGSLVYVTWPVAFLFLMPIVAGQWQSATNRLVEEREGRVWAGPGLQAPQAPQPPSAG